MIFTDPPSTDDGSPRRLRTRKAKYDAGRDSLNPDALLLIESFVEGSWLDDIDTAK